MTAPDGFYINASSPNADLAKGFALQFLQPANEQIFADAGHLPANTTLQPKDPIAQSFSALMPKGFARPTAKELNNYWGNFGNAIVAVIDKGTDPTKAVADACVPRWTRRTQSSPLVAIEAGPARRAGPAPRPAAGRRPRRPGRRSGSGQNAR
jgi:hypothetical protein